MDSCRNHPATPAIDHCIRCQQPHCLQCFSDGKLCTTCAARAKRNKTARVALFAVAVVILAAGATWLFWDQSKSSPAKPVALSKPVEMSKEDPSVRSARAESLKRCDRNTARTVATELLRVREFRTLIEFNRAFQASCEVYEYLDWKAFHAHKELGEWEAALKKVSEFIERTPTDDDFWWWRGEVREKLRQPKAASLADYRMSLALTANVLEFLVPDLATAEGCEAVFAAAHIQRNLKLPLSASDAAAVRAGSRKNSCKDTRKGETRIPLPNALQDVELAVKAGTQAAKFLVDTASGTTMISHKLAVALGLDLSRGVPAETFAAGQLWSGLILRLPELTIGGASVQDLDVLVIPENETLGTGFDGVVGGNFVWRFEIRPEAKALRLLVPNDAF